MGARNTPMSGNAKATAGMSLNRFISVFDMPLVNGTVIITTAAAHKRQQTNTASQSVLFNIKPAKNLPAAIEMDNMLAIFMLKLVDK